MVTGALSGPIVGLLSIVIFKRRKEVVGTGCDWAVIAMLVVAASWTAVRMTAVISPDDRPMIHPAKYAAMTRSNENTAYCSVERGMVIVSGDEGLVPPDILPGDTASPPVRREVWTSAMLRTLQITSI